MKYNLLPDSFQERFDELEVDWTEMAHAKFLSEAHKCETADTMACLKKEKEERTSGKRKRGEQQSNLTRPNKEKIEKGRARREPNATTGAGQARLCALCKAAGAPEYVYKLHNSKDCKKKGQYERLLSGGASSREKAMNEFSQNEKKFRREFKLMAKKVKQLEAKGARKTRRRGENSDDSSFASSTDNGF